MQIPETPKDIQQLDFMIRLKKYSDGAETWHDDGAPLGDNAKKECTVLYSHILSMVQDMFDPLLSRTTSREMETFTLHDPGHARKVAHVMWHILKPEQRNRLTPPEIALLIMSAYLHDLGMASTMEERRVRLDPSSDLWDKLEFDESLKQRIEDLRAKSQNDALPPVARDRARHALDQAEEALLCIDTRERHATHERYNSLIQQLRQFHYEDPKKLPDIDTCLCFAGDSFKDKLIEICTSHGEEIEYLLSVDESNIERPRFPNDYTIGTCLADLHLVAAALRIADILDFDRERTPAALFHYLLPTNLTLEDDRSVLEWSKHMAISHWEIGEDAIVFRGHCTHHVVHHAIVQFCREIEAELQTTIDSFEYRSRQSPFRLPLSVQTQIEQRGYTYVPYEFKLDDHRVYELLMGGAIYDDPLVALRELVQNAVDACKLRDAVTQLSQPYIQSANRDRIFVRYEEPTSNCPFPKLTVTDTGTGMDKNIIEEYFLRVGRSYYRSRDFRQIRLKLKDAGSDLDFAPVSEFGIGFLSCFLLADRVEIQTAMWKGVRGDTDKRTLLLDGPTRLIRVKSESNAGMYPFSGTAITLYLVRGAGRNQTCPPTWEQIYNYLRGVCHSIPYEINMAHIDTNGRIIHAIIEPRPLTAQLPTHITPFSVRIPVDDPNEIFKGELVIVSDYMTEEYKRGKKNIAQVVPDTSSDEVVIGIPLPRILRGGFVIDSIREYSGCTSGYLSLNWDNSPKRKYPMVNLARNASANYAEIDSRKNKICIEYLFNHSRDLPRGIFLNHFRVDIQACNWLEKYSALQIVDALWHDLALFAELEDDLYGWTIGDIETIIYPHQSSRLLSKILNYILPRICRLGYDSDEYRIFSPVKDWRKILGEWHTFISKPTLWGLYCTYMNIDRRTLYIEHYLGDNHYINDLYEDRITGHFNSQEQHVLREVLHELYDTLHGSGIAVFDDEQMDIFNKAVMHLGDLLVGSKHNGKILKDFRMQ